jgi:phosphate transport system protein
MERKTRIMIGWHAARTGEDGQRAPGREMKKHYAGQLDALREKVLRMGGLVEQMTHRVIQALVERNVAILDEVRTMEQDVNLLHVEIDEMCLELIALQQPAAFDLRFITAAMRINADMERIGDQAINIVERAESLLDVPPVKPLIDIPRMAEIAKEMLKDALDSFVNHDPELAMAAIRKDDLVDQLKDQIFRELLTFMMSDPSTITRAMDLILVARHLERIADHATNICEYVIFMVKGKDVRHQGPLA